MKKIIPAITVFLMVLITGCRTMGPEPDAKPIWVLQPESALEDPRFLAAISAQFAEKPGEQPEQAHAGARRRIAEQTYGYVSDSVHAFFSANPDLHPGRTAAVVQFTEAMAIEVSSKIMRSPLKKEVWMPEEKEDDGYLLIRVPIAAINNAIKDTGPSLSRDYTVFEPDTHSLAIDKFFQNLDDNLKKRIAEAAIRDMEEIGTGKVPLHSPPPPWLVIGKSREFPSDRYVMSIGMGKNADAARANAEREALRQTAALARAKATSITLDPDSAPEYLARHIKHLPAELLQSLPTKAFDVNIGKMWYDSAVDVHYALAVINRESAAALCIGKAEKHIEDWQHLFRAGLNQGKAGNHRQALDNMLIAAVEAETALQNCLIAFALKAPVLEIEIFQEYLTELSLGKTYAELNRALQQFKIIPEKGPELWAPAPERGRRILQAKIVAGAEERPASNMPVKFEFVNMGGDFERGNGNSVVVKSNYNGIAVAEVRRIRTRHARDEPAISITLAVEEILPGKRIYGRLQPPAADFSYLSAEKRNIYLALSIKETEAEGIEQQLHVVQNILAEKLQNAGLILLDEEETGIPGATLTELPDEDLLEKLRDLSGKLEKDGPVIFTTGVSYTEITDTRETSLGTLAFAACRINLRIITAGKEPEIIAEIEAEGLAAAADEEKAVREAGNEAAARISVSILSFLRSD